MDLQELTLYRNNSSSRSTKKILPLNYVKSMEVSNNSSLARVIPLTSWYKTQNVVEMIRSLGGLFSFSSIIPTCRWLSNPRGIVVSPGLGRKVTGTLFGTKKGYVSFAVQEDPRSEPVFLIELPTSTCGLVKEMSSGLVRIALECEKVSGHGKNLKLFKEPLWTMYCNGKKYGQASLRTCIDSDWYLLSSLQTVSAGAGLIPLNKELSLSTNDMEGDVMYLRGRFERAVGNRNSEAYYMMNPDGNGGPELSIFFLRM
ncbi:hypothetical protein ACHQM5_019104 [Ranunculus cassubicifolius]